MFDIYVREIALEVQNKFPFSARKMVNKHTHRLKEANILRFKENLFRL